MLSMETEEGPSRAGVLLLSVSIGGVGGRIPTYPTISTNQPNQVNHGTKPLKS